MGGQHLRVGVDVHPGALGLLQKHLQIPQIMPGYQDARILPHADLYPGDLRVAVAAGIGLIQQGHALHAVLARLQHQSRQFLQGQTVIQRGSQSTLQERIHLLIGAQQSVGMLGVGSQPLQSIGNQLPQRAHILILGGEHAHRPGLGLPITGTIPPGRLGERRRVLHLGQQAVPDLQGLRHPLGDGRLIKVGIGNGGKEIPGHQMADLRGHALTLGAQGGGHRRQSPGYVHQQILHSRHIRRFSAHTGAGAAGAAGSLLALIAKHVLIHFHFSCLVFSQSIGLGGKHDGQQHFERLRCEDRVGNPRRHHQRLTGVN